MKLEEAMRIINATPGYMVSFEINDGYFLKSDHFPDKHAGEELIATQKEAWDLAEKFASKCKNAVNVYVTDSNFIPVTGYQHKILKNYP